MRGGRFAQAKRDSCLLEFRIPDRKPALERVTEGVAASPEYLEFVHHFMTEWEA